MYCCGVRDSDYNPKAYRRHEYKIFGPEDKLKFLPAQAIVNQTLQYSKPTPNNYWRQLLKKR